MTGSMQGSTLEPRQDEELRWGPLVLTREKLVSIWEQMQQFPQVFDDYSRGNFDDFASKFLVASNVFIDIGPGLGLAAGFAVRPGLDAILHLVMFDRRLRGREPIFKEIMGYFFDRLKLRRMTAMLADDCQTAIKLVERLGFKKEGTLRNALLRDGAYLNVHLFGLLKEEL